MWSIQNKRTTHLNAVQDFIHDFQPGVFEIKLSFLKHKIRYAVRTRVYVIYAVAVAVAIAT